MAGIFKRGKAENPRPSCTGAEGQQSFGQAFSKACSFQRRRLWSLPAGSEMLFRREPFLCFFLFAIQKERRKPPALHRGRHPGRGTAGLLVTNGGSRLELKSPTGRCQGVARAAHQKHPGGMFLRAEGPGSPLGLGEGLPLSYICSKGRPPGGPLSLPKIHQYFLGKRFLVEKN